MPIASWPFPRSQSSTPSLSLSLPAVLRPVRLIAYRLLAGSVAAPEARLAGVLNRSRARRATGALAAARAALGIVAFVVPSVPARPWVGSGEAELPAVRLFARTLGARDLALGLGALLALRHDKEVRGWVEAGGLADGGDTIATLMAFRRLPKRSRWGILASTVGAATAAALLAPFVDEP